MKYNDIEVKISANIEESKKHIEEDFQTIMKKGIDNIIKENFIPWITATDYKDRDKNKIFEGLKLYGIDYYYGKIVDKYSPTGETNYFGQFNFNFESGSEYTDDIFEAVCMEIIVLDGKIVQVNGFDI